MKEKIKRVYESVEELREAIESGRLKVNDEFVTKDIDGKATFICIQDGKAYHFLRKYTLKDAKPMKSGNFFLLNWLAEEYTHSLPKELQEILFSPVGLLTEKEMFGVNEFGVEEEGKQIKWCKKIYNRIAAESKDAEYTKWYWLQTPTEKTDDIASSANFCNCYGYGVADCSGASNAGNCVRPRFILVKRS